MGNEEMKMSYHAFSIIWKKFESMDLTIRTHAYSACMVVS